MTVFRNGERVLVQTPYHPYLQPALYVGPNPRDPEEHIVDCPAWARAVKSTETLRRVPNCCVFKIVE